MQVSFGGRSDPNWLISKVRWDAVILVLLICGTSRFGRCDEPSGLADRFEQTVRPLMEEHCIDCHGADTQERGLRLDQLVGSLKHPGQGELLWQALVAVESEMMPPPDSSELTADERKRIIDWAKDWMRQAAPVQRARRGRLGDRRLTVDEYNRTMQALFGVECCFSSSLPPDPIAHTGYQNDRKLLSFSPLQLEYYLEIAKTSVERYVASDSGRESVLRYDIEPEEVYYTTKDRVGTKKKAPRPKTLAASEKSRDIGEGNGRFAFPLPAMPPGELPATEALRESQPKLHQLYLPIHKIPQVGEYVIRVRAAATAGRQGTIPRMRIEAGVAYGDGDNVDAWRVGEVDVASPTGSPGVFEFRGRLEDVPKPRPGDKVSTLYDITQIFISNVARDKRAVYRLGPGSLKRSEQPKYPLASNRDNKLVQQIDELRENGVNLLHIDSVHIEFLPQVHSKRWRIADKQLSSTDSSGQVRRFLRRFMQEAYRRPVNDVELQDKLDLYRRLAGASDGATGRDALQSVLTSVLVSPHFLLVDAPSSNANVKAKLFDLPQRASRLSYLFWSAMPDSSLQHAANSGRLADGSVWRSEAERLLDDSRGDAFIEAFCRQWLRLDRFSLVAINPEHYPKYDEDLAEMTIEQTLREFRRLFREGRSAMELIDSPTIMLNDRLAEHYGLPPVVGGRLRSVTLPSGSVRGGLLTQASLLTMNSDGVDSHPIRRGVWLVDRLLGNPPPPPPPDIPLIDEKDPDFRGLTLKQRLELHRKPGRCYDCHQRFDPWGVALEEFDATGRWRKTIPPRDDRGAVSVDAATTMSDGVKVSGVIELRNYLLRQHRESFTRSLVVQMMTYALGRKLDFADQLEVDDVHRHFQKSGFQLRELAIAIIETEAFRDPPRVQSNMPLEREGTVDND